jgi:hypothetical protein
MATVDVSDLGLARAADAESFAFFTKALTAAVS